MKAKEKLENAHLTIADLRDTISQHKIEICYIECL